MTLNVSDRERNPSIPPDPLREEVTFMRQSRYRGRAWGWRAAKGAIVRAENQQSPGPRGAAATRHTPPTYSPAPPAAGRLCCCESQRQSVCVTLERPARTDSLGTEPAPSPA